MITILLLPIFTKIYITLNLNRKLTVQHHGDAASWLLKVRQRSFLQTPLTFAKGLKFLYKNKSFLKEK